MYIIFNNFVQCNHLLLWPPCRWKTAIDAAAVQIARSHVATELPKAFLISMQRKLVESNGNAKCKAMGTE